MKIIYKKPLWFTVTATLCLVVVTLFAASGCDKTEIQPKHYTVNFVGEGVGIEPQSITHGNYATVPENPEREGYDFGGWFTDNGTFVNEWDFKTNIVTQDTTLYAQWEENTLQDYPIEIPFTEYSITGTSCQWTNFESNKGIIINSDEKLQNYIVCADDDYSKIDFSEHSLLLVRVGATSGIRYIDINFFKETANEYTLNVLIHTDMTAVAPGRLISIIVPKIDDEVTITLNVQQIEDGYMDTVHMEGIGYLFVNSIPIEQRYRQCDIMSIFYNKEDFSVTFFAGCMGDTTYSGNICNFPDFAKEWEIPTEGKQIYYKGELHIIGMYASWPPHIGGDLILTTLK